AKWLDVTGQAALGLPRALGDHPQLPILLGEQGQNPVGLAEIAAAQDHRLSTIEADTFAVFSGGRWVAHPVHARFSLAELYSAGQPPRGAKAAARRPVAKMCDVPPRGGRSASRSMCIIG